MQLQINDRAVAPPLERPWNPLAASATASRHSCYTMPSGGLLLRPLAGYAPASPCAERAHEVLRAHVLSSGFPCVGARSALNRGRYRFGVYPALGTEAVAKALCHDLYEFSHEFPKPGTDAVSYLAFFAGPAAVSETDFERSLWAQLGAMHEVDKVFFGWDETVSRDAESSEFSFSIGGRAYFIVGMHPAASRVARQTPWTLVAFNFHEQFVALRAEGRYDGLQQVTRNRDIALQGSLNPMLHDHGQSSEARQYAGRAVASGWSCPFAHSTLDDSK